MNTNKLIISLVILCIPGSLLSEGLTSKLFDLLAFSSLCILLYQQRAKLK